LRLFNAFGSERQPLEMPLQVEYWSGNSWLLSSTDVCTVAAPNTGTGTAAVLGIPNFFRSNALTNIASVIIANGQGRLIFAAPGPGITGSIDIAANLGRNGNDLSCLSNHGGVPGNAPWLRSRNGSCATSYDRDPSARATFGIYSPESRRVIHMREFF